MERNLHLLFKFFQIAIYRILSESITIICLKLFQLQPPMERKKDGKHCHRGKIIHTDLLTKQNKI